jgi:hypothetical protein
MTGIFLFYIYVTQIAQLEDKRIIDTNHLTFYGKRDGFLAHIFLSVLNFIKRNLKVNSKSVKEKAYTSLIRPKLEYSSCVWDPHTKSKNDQ